MESTSVNWESLDSLVIDFAKSENLIENSHSSPSPPSSPSSSSSSSSSLSSYHSRLLIRQIRKYTELGDIDSAIDLLRIHAPFILDDHRLLFRLQKQAYSFLWTAKDRDCAIECVRNALAPCALDAYPEAYEEFKHVLLAFIYDKDDHTSPVANECYPEYRFHRASFLYLVLLILLHRFLGFCGSFSCQKWSEMRRFEIAGLMSSVLRAQLHAYDPVFALTLRYLISIHKGFCLRQGMSSPISDLTERLLLEERDPAATPQETFYEAPPFDEASSLYSLYLKGFGSLFELQVDIQALAHAVELTRQGAVDSLKFAKGDLFQAFQVLLFGGSLESSWKINPGGYGVENVRKYWESPGDKFRGKFIWVSILKESGLGQKGIRGRVAIREEENGASSSQGQRHLPLMFMETRKSASEEENRRLDQSSLVADDRNDVQVVEVQCEAQLGAEMQLKVLEKGAGLFLIQFPPMLAWLQNELCRIRFDAPVLDELVWEYCIYRGIVDSGAWTFCGSSRGSQPETGYSSSVDCGTSKHSDGETSVGNKNMDDSPEVVADSMSKCGIDVEVRYPSMTKCGNEDCSTSGTHQLETSRVLRSRGYVSGERSRRKRWRGRQDNLDFVTDISLYGMCKKECDIAATTVNLKVQQALEKSPGLEFIKRAEDKYEILLGIKELTDRGMAAEVVEEINALDPNFFIQNPILLFQLKQVEFLKLVSSGDHSSALRVACSHLGPLAAGHPAFLKPLKETLLAFVRPDEEAIGKGLPLQAVATSIQMCKDRFEGLLRIDSLKETSSNLTADTASKSNADNCTLGSSQVTLSSNNRTPEDGGSINQASSSDLCDENAILKVMEFLALPRADAIHLLAQYNGNAETAIQQIFA
ncbi:hypothetical protein RJ641_011325 [Dillenia turbinata]|uniref:CTLH domain-containing protein n=1 Tax=Dillenia turbinata TaxID=194707 RepID=A0AAN8V464_9MAGN